MSLYLVIAISLLMLGVLGSLVPSVPGPLFSLVGVLIYWWSTGYSSPATLPFLIMVSTSLFALIIDWIATYAGARKTGVPSRTAYIGVLTGVVLFFVSGPAGIVAGIVGTIFVGEKLNGKDTETALRASLVTGIAFLASTAAKFVLTSLVLLVFVVSTTLL